MPPGVTTLGAVTTAAQQRADMFNDTFVSNTEWTANINASYQELYGLIAQSFGDDYLVQTPYTFSTDGINYLFALPSDFFKLLGVDLQVGSQWATIKPFMFGERNRYSFSNGIPVANQNLRLWYIPRLTLLVNAGDTLDGVNGWEEFIVIDAAIKALQKEESDCSLLMAQRQAIITRIEDEAARRDAGMPIRITDTRRANGYWLNRFYGVTGLRYRLTGSNLWLSPSDDVWYANDGGFNG
jgi:hypothetical protein